MNIFPMDSQLTRWTPYNGLPIDKIASTLCIYKIFNVLTCALSHAHDLVLGRSLNHVQRVQSFCQLKINVGRRGTNQLRLLERYLDVLVKHTTEIPPPTALVEGTALSALVEGVSLR